jgi:hypothetical protein
MSIHSAVSVNAVPTTPAGSRPPGRKSRRSLASRLAMAALAGTALAGLSLSSDATAQADRLIVALDPPTVETGRFWHTDGATGVFPSHEMLIGNDI